MSRSNRFCRWSASAALLSLFVTLSPALAEEPPAAAERDKLGVGRKCPWGERANRVTRSNVRQQSNAASVSRLHVPD